MITCRMVCRSYQAVLRLAAHALDITPPELVEGVGSLSRVPGILRSKGISRVLVVTGKSLSSRGLLDPFFAALGAEGMFFAHFDAVQSEPSIANVEACAARYRSEQCQAIVAIGGGSPLDCAKVAGARVSNPERSVRELRGLLRVRRRPPLFIAVPTTAGTGSETTLAAVISDPDAHEKFAVTDPKLMPDCAVLDPLLSVSLPPDVTAATGMDALTHAVEAYIGRSNTALTCEMAERAVPALFANLERAWADGSDIGARGALLRASYDAGVAFTRAYVGYVHAIAHAVGALYHIPHGKANAVILPPVLAWYGSSAVRPLSRLAKLSGIGSDEKTAAGKASAFIGAIRGLNVRMGIGSALPEIREADVPLIASRALREANPLYPVPRIMGRRDCEALVRGLMEATR